MSDPAALLAEALAFEGATVVVLAALLAGFVRGFTGFGSGLVFMPLAVSVVPPVWALSAFLVVELVAPLSQLPRALRVGVPGQVGLMCAGALVTLPVGLSLLLVLPESMLRLAVSGMTLIALGVMLSGWRYRGPVRGSGVAGIGGAAGLVGGSTGLVGPPVILFYMASPLPVQVIRANIVLFLQFAAIAMLAMLWLAGALVRAPLLLGVVLILPYALAIVAGAAMFRPGRERLYRGVSYAVIAASALAGLPWPG